MIKMQVLTNGKYLGVVVFEVVSFPSVQNVGLDKVINNNNVSFAHLLSELHKLSGEGTCLEILWMTDKASHQTFTSFIRFYIIIRKIGIDEEIVKRELESLLNDFYTTLLSLQYQLKKVVISGDEFTSRIENVDDSCLYGIIKKEKCSANSYSLYPYYYSDIIPNDNRSNFESLISALSKAENCCVSFQLFPDVFMNNERYTINEIASEMGMIANGTMINRQLYRDSLATEPLKVFSYYSQRFDSPVFRYNVLVYGERGTCANIATKVMSLLQSGDKKVASSDFNCIDLSSEKIDLDKQWMFYPYNINIKLIYQYRDKSVFSTIPLAGKIPRLPYLVSLEEASSFFRLPIHDGKMASIKSNQFNKTSEHFSEEVVSDDNIQIGRLAAEDQSHVTIGCSPKSFTKHALIVGTPGSGKTTFSINLLLQFAQKGVPFLAIEPTKTEYRSLIDIIPNMRIFTPGKNSVSPYIINPFIPPRGIRIEQYVPSLASAFKAAFSMPSPLDMFFLKAIRTCYMRYGWKDYSKFGDEDVKIFGIHEFIIVFKELIGNTNYSKEVRGNLESAGLLRLNNLIEQNSNIYDNINTVPIEDLLTAPTVLELNSVDNAEQKSLIIALLLISICLYTKNNQSGDGNLKNVLLIDEAHVLLGGNNPKNLQDGAPDSQATTIKAIQDMIAEIRSYGTSIIIADQSPTKVSREVIANTDIKVAFRLVQASEKELIADSTNMSMDEKNALSRLKPGEAFVYYSKLELPQMIITEDVREKSGIRLSVSDEYIVSRSTYWKDNKMILVPYKECELCKSCQKNCDFKIRSDAEYISDVVISKYRNSLSSDDSIKKLIYYLPNIFKNMFKDYDESFERIVICTRIKLLRKIQLEHSNNLSAAEIRNIITKFPK